jgi:hypothetical protein
MQHRCAWLDICGAEYSLTGLSIEHSEFRLFVENYGVKQYIHLFAETGQNDSRETASARRS